MGLIVDRFLSPRKPTQPATRIRFNISQVYDGSDGYGREYYRSNVTEDPNGAALSSLLTNGLHAPVLDVDNAVTATADGDDTLVTFKLRALKRYEMLDAKLDRLVRLGFARSARLERTNWFKREVAIRFPYPVIALPSRTPGHFHLLVQKEMTWDEAKSLAGELAWCELTDPRHAKISSRGDFLYVANTDTSHDSI